MIFSIKVENLLSFGPDPVQLKLGPLTVLVGPNGSGKSNFLDVLTLLHRLCSSGNTGPPIRDRIWRGAPSDEHNAARASVETMIQVGDQLALRHYLRFFHNTHYGGFAVDRETIDDGSDCFFEYKRGHGAKTAPAITGEKRTLIPYHSGSWDDNRSVLSQLHDPQNYPEIGNLLRTYEKIRLYRNVHFGPSSPSRQPQPTDLSNGTLLEDASNLALVLNRHLLDPGRKRRLIDLLKRFYDPATDIGTYVEGNTARVLLTERSDTAEWEWVMPSERLSDGTMRWLALLAILLEVRPGIVCIDEPDLGLHPDILPTLADLLVEASQRMQIIITTHSDALIDAFSDRPECVVICEKVDGCTQLTRLDKDRLCTWLEKYSLGELWNSGQIGGRRF